MKNKTLSIIFAGIALISVSTAVAHESYEWYVSGAGSVGLMSDSNFEHSAGAARNAWKSGQNPALGGSIAIGHIIDSWRVELEVSHRHTSSKKTSFSEVTKHTKVNYKGNTSFMGNVYYDIPVCEDISVYVGAGAGMSLVHASVNTPNDNIDNFINTLANIIYPEGYYINKSGVRDEVFAYQFMTGITYALCDNWNLTLGYRFFATTKPTFYDGYGHKIKATKTPYSNNVELGLRFKF